MKPHYIQLAGRPHNAASFNCVQSFMNMLKINEIVW